MNEQGGKSATNTCARAACSTLTLHGLTSCLALFGIEAVAVPGGKRFSAPATKILRKCIRPSLNGILTQVLMPIVVHEFRESSAVEKNHLFLPRPEAESSSSVGGAGRGGGARVCLTRAVTHAAEGERKTIGRGGIISGHHAGKPPHLICKRNPLGREGERERGRGGEASFRHAPSPHRRPRTEPCK